MLSGCLYHLLDHLLPSRISIEREDFLRLEYLSACKIMEDGNTADRLLPYIPHRLYPALFQAIAQKQFNTWRISDGEPHSASTLSLLSMMKYWPEETMIVRNIMPPMCFRASKKTSKRMPLSYLLQDYDKFCKSFLSILPFVYLSRYSSDDDKLQKDISSTIKQLDVSGYCSYVTDYHYLVALEEKVKRAYNPNTPPGYNASVLVMDICIVPREKQLLSLLRVICTLSQQHGAGLVVKWRCVRIMSATSRNLTSIIEILLQSKSTKYLEIETSEVSESVKEKIAEMSSMLHGFSLSYFLGATSLEFLSHLTNLRQLIICGARIGDSMHVLSNLSQGLKYLKLVGCRLGAKDLDILANSKHVGSLLHLDLCDNAFGLPLIFSSLCTLCQKLEKIMVLELGGCKLNRLTDDNINLFIDILRVVPCLRLLKLCNNDFSSRTLVSQISQLGYSHTLQCLFLTVPSEIYLSDNYSVTESQINKLHSDVAKQIESIPSSQLLIEWNEEVSYSHWYYSV